MEKLQNVKNEWDGEMRCPEVMGPRCLISKKRLKPVLKEYKLRKKQVDLLV